MMRGRLTWDMAQIGDARRIDGAERVFALLHEYAEG